MKQVQPAEFRSLQMAANYVDAGLIDPVALTQKHARILRMSVLRAKRTRLSNPATEPCIGFNPQMVDPVPINQFISDPGGVEVGRGAVTSCQEEVRDTSLVENKGSYIGVESDEETEKKDETESEEDELAYVWKEMALAIECCKEIPEGQLSSENESEDEVDCDHSFVLKDDIGYVCRVCGLVQKGIEDIFEFLFPKRTRTRSYTSEPLNINDDKQEESLPDWYSAPKMDVTVTEDLPYTKLIELMKPHQMAGFKFLLSNLVTEDPHGCILAHAPGSGKTFMIICFMQSFLAEYPSARPLVVLPKGILSTWKKEFQRWQVHDIPLYDFYSAKAGNRVQQLNVLKQWVQNKSILFLGYKQFSSIVSGRATCQSMASCQEILVKTPTVLILDEGHTPRNKDTDTLDSLTRVQTPRKVVLSGTLYQNHVKEVFNILNLVQPRFLKLEANLAKVRRIMSKVDTHGVRKKLRGAGDAAFYDLLENTLLKDGNYQRKIGVIKDLREMTGQVLHYYKGDSFNELPGLMDFTVLLKLSPKQRADVDKLKKLKERKFKTSSLGSAIYIHPQLKQFSESSNKIKQENSAVSNEKLDQIIKKVDLKDGVKAKFFLNMLRLCECEQEKLLVFSHYLLPLKFLGQLAVHFKGWIHDKQIFTITGESTTEHREWSMERFNTSPDARVFFGSIKACGEGISLVGASRILILDVHPNPSVSWQAICRAFRPGQKKKVYTYRLVAADSPEEEDHLTCSRKELIAKMWFEWNEFSEQKEFDCEAVDLEGCDDRFLQSPPLANDVKALFRRNTFCGK